MKILVILSLCLFSLSSFAQNCATSVEGLKRLVGNSDFQTVWKEQGDKNPFTLQLSDKNNSIHLRLSTKDGEWASMNTRVCVKGRDKFVAEVQQIVWGSAAPGIAKGRSVKEVGISLPYHSLLKVSISILWKGEFSPVY